MSNTTKTVRDKHIMVGIPEWARNMDSKYKGAILCLSFMIELYGEDWAKGQTIKDIEEIMSNFLDGDKKETAYMIGKMIENGYLS